MTKAEALNTLMKMRAWRAWGKEQKEEERPEMPEQKEVDEAFDVCIKLLQVQLPSNLDEAAEECAIREGYLAGLHYETMKRVFKAGAELMAGQGFISEGIINQTSGEDTIIELNEHIGYLEDCEEVIVNIRKKQ